ncbi:MAG: SRPBCC domain-containing protein [Proteobacteria bacterium]|nr:SRPBCC domain-containing protein [Pseudomonadota bacterium]
MTFDFTVTDFIPAEPKQIYDAWLDSRVHAKMTGDRPATVTANEGGWFVALRGFVIGKNVALDPGRRIVQTLRTKEFLESDADSKIEVLLDPAAGGTQITIHHTNVPDQLSKYRDAGWQSNYFEPMKRFFGA